MKTRSVEDCTETHCNRSPFEGVLTFVDRPSERSPNGARGHSVFVPKDVAESALPGLLGMGVCYKSSWDGHDQRRKIGVIDGAAIEGCEVKVWGYLYGRDFPDVLKALDRKSASKLAFGMSYELADAHVADMRCKIWTLTRFTFTGAAILLRERAAYDGTSFWLSEGGDGEEAAGQAGRQRGGEESP